MRILYFSLGYSTHDYRFLKSISESGHEVFFVQLEGNTRQVEDRSVPPNVRLVLWKGGHEPFKWSNLPKLVLDFRRLTREIKPDLIHAGPIQTCAFIAILSGFRPILTMSWGFDLMDDVHHNKWWEWVTCFTLKRSTFFISDAMVTRDKAVAYGMNPNKTIVFPWGVDLEHFKPSTSNLRPSIFHSFLQPLLGASLRCGCACASICASSAKKRKCKSAHAWQRFAGKCHSPDIAKWRCARSGRIWRTRFANRLAKLVS